MAYLNPGIRVQIPEPVNPQTIQVPTGQMAVDASSNTTVVYDGNGWVDAHEFTLQGEAEMDDVAVHGELTLPEVFPTEQEVYNMLLDAVRVCVGDNMLRPMVDSMIPVLGDEATIFNDSILFKDIGMDGSLDLFQGYVPVQQFLGRVLHNEDVMLAFIGEQTNSLVNASSMVNTNVYHRSNEGGRVRVEHKMPFSVLAQRYLRNTSAQVEVLDNDMMLVLWYVPYRGNDMTGLMYAAEHLGSVLTIYYKLLTRFPSCQSYQNALPSFRNS